MSAALILPHAEQHRAAVTVRGVICIKARKEIRWAATVRPYAAEGGGETSPLEAPARQFQTTTGGNRVMNTRTATPEQKIALAQEIAEAALNGGTMSAVAAKHGVPTSVASRWFAQTYGCDILRYRAERTPPQPPREQWATQREKGRKRTAFLRAIYEEGMRLGWSWAQMGEKAGVSAGSFRQTARTKWGHDLGTPAIVTTPIKPVEQLARQRARGGFSDRFRKRLVEEYHAEAARTGDAHAALRTIAGKHDVTVGHLARWACLDHEDLVRAIDVPAETEDARRLRVWTEGKAAGLQHGAIAAVLGISHSTLTTWVQRNVLTGKAEQRAEVASRAKQRHCLRCRDPFMSEGPGHRMCGGCRALSHMDSPYAPSPGGGTGKRVGARRP